MQRKNVARFGVLCRHSCRHFFNYRGPGGNESQSLLIES
jgi:hypothetical protein